MPIRAASAVLILCFTAEPAWTQPNSAASSGEQVTAEPANAKTPADIVVYGRRTDDRYRIPEELRNSPSAAPDRRASGIDPRLACQAVGPMGCGIKPLPIITVGSDGKVRIGASERP